MVLTPVYSYPGRSGRGRGALPTQGGARCPSALAIEATGALVTRSELLRCGFAPFPTRPGASGADATQPQQCVQLAHTQ